jgi:hypothetical protein
LQGVIVLVHQDVVGRVSRIVGIDRFAVVFYDVGAVLDAADDGELFLEFFLVVFEGAVSFLPFGA